MRIALPADLRAQLQSYLSRTWPIRTAFELQALFIARNAGPRLWQSSGRQSCGVWCHIQNRGEQKTQDAAAAQLGGSASECAYMYSSQQQTRKTVASKALTYSPKQHPHLTSQNRRPKAKGPRITARTATPPCGGNPYDRPHAMALSPSIPHKTHSNTDHLPTFSAHNTPFEKHVRCAMPPHQAVPIPPKVPQHHSRTLRVCRAVRRCWRGSRRGLFTVSATPP